MADSPTAATHADKPEEVPAAEWPCALLSAQLTLQCIACGAEHAVELPDDYRPDPDQWAELAATCEGCSKKAGRPVRMPAVVLAGEQVAYFDDNAELIAWIEERHPEILEEYEREAPDVAQLGAGDDTVLQDAPSSSGSSETEGGARGPAA